MKTTKLFLIPLILLLACSEECKSQHTSRWQSQPLPPFITVGEVVIIMAPPVLLLSITAGVSAGKKTKMLKYLGLRATQLDKNLLYQEYLLALEEAKKAARKSRKRN